MSGQVYRLTIYPEKDHFGRCYAAASEVARRLELNPEEEFRFAVSVSEAYTNAFIHGNKSNPSKWINVVFSWDQETVRVDVEDQGEGKPEALHLDDSRPDIDSEKSGGRGVGIMKLFADRMEVEERQEGGLRVSVSFRLCKKNRESAFCHKSQTEE
jgi:anti-sigma regulatory factor (Ser/Thr protein kinase)